MAKLIWKDKKIKDMMLDELIAEVNFKLDECRVPADSEIRKFSWDEAATHADAKAEETDNEIDRLIFLSAAKVLRDGSRVWDAIIDADNLMDIV